ncbi:IGSF2 protein, partial [Molothrus ater]|nr:IGSF2 protein [Molothrus ater]
TGLTSAQRQVTVQEGPLYRTEGSHVTLWCKVSGYQGPAEQNFQWSIYLPSAPEREVQIVSTVDPSFPYAIYTQRVRGRGIFVERLQGDAVLLHITELQERDAGQYECHTPNTDERYLGSYSAKTNLTVIPDTLSASMAPQALSHMEGDVVELTCEVSKATAQHTHLSVGWYLLQGAGEQPAKEILTLSKDFILKPGPSYEQRFLEGDVQLNKVGNTTYKLIIRGVKPSDQGQLYCEAAEWIEDPDKTWKDISRNQTQRTWLAVLSRGTDLSVDLTAAEPSLSEGDTLQLSCVVEAPKSSNFKVVWLLNDMEVARVDPHGVLTWEEEYQERARLGQLRAFKPSNTVYVLTISEVGLEDKGTYQCSVSEMKTPGDLQSIQTVVSSGIQVDVKPVEIHLRLSVSTSTPRVTAGDALVLHCEVQGATGPVSLRWWHLPPQQPGHRELVAAMEQDGALNLGSAYRDGGARGSLRLQKESSGTFTLVIPSTLDEDDGGQYRCEATQWSRGRNWTGKGEAAVMVGSIAGLGLQATLRSRIATVSYGQSFELFCQVGASYALEEVPVSVRWRFQPNPPTSPLEELVQVLPNGTVLWGAAQPRFQGKAQLAKTDTSFRLHIHSALPANEGTYQCEVEVWRRNVLPLGRPAASTSSNAVGIKVVLPGSKLQVDTKDSSVEIASGNLAIQCRIVFAQENSQFAVTWYLLPPLADTKPLQILRANYTSVLEYGSEFSSPALKSRFLSQRVSSSLFQLQILSANLGDEGSYYCVVEEWLWLVDGWYKLGERTSGRTTLKFKLSGEQLQMEKTNDSISAREGEEATLPCRLQSALPPRSQLTATWFQVKGSGRDSALLSLQRDGTVQYPEGRLAARLFLRRASARDFSLTLSGVKRGDAGAYYCQLQEWQQQGEGKDWALQALARSGHTQLITIPPESTVLSRICSSPPLLNFILYLPLVLILLLALAVFCWYCKFRK